MAQDPFDEALLDSVPLTEVLSELKRELAMRQHKYPGWIAAKTLKADTAQRQMLRLRAAIKILEKVWADAEAKTSPSLPFEGGAGTAKTRGHGEDR